jgi:hypothetical protein
VELYAFIERGELPHERGAKIAQGLSAHGQYNDRTIKIEHSSSATGNLDPFILT